MMTEFGLIAAIEQMTKQLPDNGFEGIGDDCALLPIGGGEVLCFTADLVVEGVHFLRQTMTPEEVAEKALQVNLSDVASMGVRPVATLLSVALPREVMEGDWVERFMASYGAASQRSGVALIGGDTTASERDIVINVTAIGRGREEQIKRRSAARVGDWIVVTAPLGGSAAGLRDLLAGRLDTPAARLHKSPEAQIEAGVWLGARREVHAMMDISDGIASDLRHILHRSAVGGEVELLQVPQHPAATREDALAGGEEYQLLFTVAEEAWPALAADYRRHFARELYAIGRITASNGASSLRWLLDGKEIEGNWQGFRHY